MHVQLVTGEGLDPAGPRHRARALLHEALLRHGVRLVEGVVRHLEPDLGVLEDDGVLPSDATLAGHRRRRPRRGRASGLATDQRGFIDVDETLRSTSHPDVFAAGDAATLMAAPRPKSGVYAVRAGPSLAANLIAALDGRAPSRFRPQRRALYLISTGGEHAVASWGPLALGADWVWRWKDRIDRAYIAKFRLP